MFAYTGKRIGICLAILASAAAVVGLFSSMNTMAQESTPNTPQKPCSQMELESMVNGSRITCPGSYRTVPGSEQKAHRVDFEYGREPIREDDGAPTARLVTYADVSQQLSSPEDVSIDVRHVLQLADGRRVLLLDDRGFASSGTWAEESVEDIERNARMVVGPDGPPPGRTEEEDAARHWKSLQRIAQQQGVSIDADALRQLPHDVVLSDRLLARIGASSTQ